MKKLLLSGLICLPFISGAQCPVWMNGTIEDAKTLLPIVEEKLQFKLLRNSDTANLDRIKYEDTSTHLAFFFIGTTTKRILVDNKIKTTAPHVNIITMGGPADRTDQIFAYIKENVKGCPGYKVGGQYVMFGDYIAVWNDDNSSDHDIPLKSIFIQKKVKASM